MLLSQNAFHWFRRIKIRFITRSFERTPRPWLIFSLHLLFFFTHSVSVSFGVVVLSTQTSLTTTNIRELRFECNEREQGTTQNQIPAHKRRERRGKRPQTDETAHCRRTSFAFRVEDEEELPQPHTNSAY